ncbi:tRNA threonylcarbamoyladenosine biosynthesis protein TsaE [Peptoniphilus asaccharolyticus DSM 20463]|uniref:tRNA threonylcarbamoyladenosine biosynthesis protein TsaE n=1 Tax=Peptoniphilus asaccharolyticus DSM 20463 TaxID=573058 RepID=A0A1W1VLS3_PEPAS|nr:tRNA (adenosine(37)-N6)-threonylcarbamoyltransferase complex ATPase subunit type 1 TsaE [Peptoniphilus asaccharolyticus]MBL7574516.1 tRNA (adenosine(37)-N6)-threonylcarbamoyltransferase complex ATPase subunit type 1 TsaE [Peptoniphilus asaccharolyticus]SMB94243.1 tRNA threonylcarbamoyladenosine biosynthesis protein TsaE [Peptoniphilus asaccharolyticus DSM 20463]
MCTTKNIKLNTLIDTEKFGESLGKMLRAGDVVCLNGELGVGKTTLTKSIAKGMGIEDYITSPTFNIINEYYGDLNLYHFDTYRLENVEEVSYLGFDEYFYGEGVCVIEWADRIKSFLPEEYLEINIREDRTAQLKAVGEHFEEILEKIEC